MEGRTHDPMILKCIHMEKHQEQPERISQRSNKLGKNYYGAVTLKFQGKLFSLSYWPSVMVQKRNVPIWMLPEKVPVPHPLRRTPEYTLPGFVQKWTWGSERLQTEDLHRVVSDMAESQRGESFVRKVLVTASWRTIERAVQLGCLLCKCCLLFLVFSIILLREERRLKCGYKKGTESVFSFNNLKSKTWQDEGTSSSYKVEWGSAVHNWWNKKWRYKGII